MKKLSVLCLAVLLSSSLIGCAAKGKKEETRVKCPACGYEFTSPLGK